MCANHIFPAENVIRAYKNSHLMWSLWLHSHRCMIFFLPLYFNFIIYLVHIFQIGFIGILEFISCWLVAKVEWTSFELWCRARATLWEYFYLSSRTNRQLKTLKNVDEIFQYTNIKILLCCFVANLFAFIRLFFFWFRSTFSKSFYLNSFE